MLKSSLILFLITQYHYLLNKKKLKNFISELNIQNYYAKGEASTWVR